MAASNVRPLKSVQAGVKVTVSESDTTTAILLEGRLDLNTAEEVRDAVRLALAHGSKRVMLDLGRLTFIDSAGVGVMMEACQLAEAQDIELWIVSC